MLLSADEPIKYVYADVRVNIFPDRKMAGLLERTNIKLTSRSALWYRSIDRKVGTPNFREKGFAESLWY